MPYDSLTLDQFIADIGIQLDDRGGVYWTAEEIKYAAWEALRVWGAYTSYWRQRGSISLDPTSSAVISLPSALPALRGYTYTLDQMVREIQLMLLEPANGLSGVGMSGQVSVSSILAAIQNSRNRLVMDAAMPLSVHNPYISPVPPDGLVHFPQSSVFVHRVSWQDSVSGLWANLWRQDAWAFDKSTLDWPTNPSTPQAYSEAELSPLQLQLYPLPLNSGILEALTVDSLLMDLTDPTALFNVPDEWIHAIKYSALAMLLNSDSQLNDPMRAQYAEKRYQQSVKMARGAKSIIRATVNLAPLQVDSMAAVDAGDPYWRNRQGIPQMIGILYDIAIVIPGTITSSVGLSLDVVTPAPLPYPANVDLNHFFQVGPEDINNIKKYVTHLLMFKCGGKEFTNTMPDYDSYMSNVAVRDAATRAKIQYLTPLFGQAQKETAERPDRVEV